MMRAPRPAWSLALPLAWMAAALAGITPAAPAMAQETAAPPPQEVSDPAAPAMLVADRVYVTDDGKLVAEGNVEAFQGDIRLRAARLTYDRATGKLNIEGPIRIDQGGAVVLAEAAELDQGLMNGLLTGARLVFDQHVQLAALQMSRFDGRYTQLYKTAITSCQVCGSKRPPLWQIRARKVIHDQEEKQIYLEGAQLRVGNVPIMYVPALRLPDPTLERATGFLIPTVRSTSQLGLGLKVPYFFKLGDDKDLTLTPYVSAKTKTLGYRYRQAFRRGRIKIEGAQTRDDLFPGEDRGYLFASGRFDLGRGFKLGFDIRTTSDNAYLVDYGLPNYDRLRSQVSLTRVRRDSWFGAALTHYKSLRDSEDESTVPAAIVDVAYEKRFFPAGPGGELRLGLEGHGHRRSSTLDRVGRDVGRFTFDAEWRRSWITAVGLRTDILMGASADTFNIRNDSLYPSRVGVTTPRAAVTLRYPLTRNTAPDVTHMLEPILQLGWSDVTGGAVPNDESGFVEFDQGNLLSLSRFPAPDRRENGARMVYGLNWARHAGSSWQAAATIGQVVRASADPDFSRSSGLSGTVSDLLLAGQLRSEKGLSLAARALMSGALSFSKVEFRGDWRRQNLNLTGTYLWLGTDPAEGRAQPVSEIWFDGQYGFTPYWTAGANLRYDIRDARATTAGFGLSYRNECVTVDLSVRRRYTSSTSVTPSTSFGFTIALNGFTVKGATQSYRRPCSSSS